jgi:hypothetical protein
MSNELTPQEKHPKFYESPHLFVGKLMVRDNKSIWYENDTEFDGYLCAKCFDYMDIQDFTPIFKPQQGEQFIKDLESAVSAGVGTQARRIIKSPKNIIAFDAEDKFHQVIMIVENDIKRVTSMLTDFDTAAYVDALRKLGYYM